MSAVAAAPVTLAVLAGEALADAVAVPDVAAPDVALVAGELLELLDEPHAAAAVASAAARMTTGTALALLPAVNLVDTMSPSFRI
jgi:ABC-type nitrate/sulfonate/bicarbonate transport system permease component